MAAKRNQCVQKTIALERSVSNISTKTVSTKKDCISENGDGGTGNGGRGMDSVSAGVMGRDRPRAPQVTERSLAPQQGGHSKK